MPRYFWGEGRETETDKEKKEDEEGERKKNPKIAHLALSVWLLSG